VAGNGNSDGSGDGGQAVNASLVSPSKVRLDQANNLYISDNNRVRKVDLSTNIISAVAGTGISGYSGDGGPAVIAELDFPQGIAFNSSGEIYIADYGNSVIRKLVSVALPTKLLSFGCFLSNADETMIKWTTALEEGTSYFDVEYSADGKQFSYLSTVKARGQSSSYSYVHCCPSYGYTYYRLKMIDQDGKYSYSNVDAVKFDPTKPDLNVFPNPTSDMVTIRYPVSTKQEIINVIDAKGTTVRQVQIPAGSDEKQISLKGFPRGIYLIQLLQSGLGPVKLILK
jgi:Secretion system C-terminal sorting domain/NHL repeat